MQTRDTVTAVLSFGFVSAWGLYAFFSYWWYELGIHSGFRGEIYGPLSFFRPASLWAAAAASFTLAVWLAFLWFTRHRRRT